MGRYSATYDMPLQDAVTSSHTSAERLADLSDNYFSGHVVQGLENPSFVRRESNNTIYEEIPGYSPTEPGSPTFITFAKVAAPEEDARTDQPTAKPSFRIETPPSAGSRESQATDSGAGLATQTTTAYVHGYGLPGTRDNDDSGLATAGHKESSFTNPCSDRDSSGSSMSKDAPPVPDKGNLSGSDVMYAAVTRQKPETAVCRIAAVIEKQYAQRR